MLLALAGGLSLAFATPPAIVPGAEFLVLAGLACWWRIAVAGSRPFLHSYVLGCVHMAWFSWSVRHVLVGAYAAIIVIGGLYFVLGTAVARAVRGRLAPLAFGLGVAVAFWLRANMPQIHYPHGQPCHCLWEWPRLLGALTVGGEALANMLLACLAATAVLLWQSWRVGVPDWRAARRGFLLALLAAIGCSVAGEVLRRVVVPESDTRVAVAAVEPGIHPDVYLGLTLEAFQERFRELFEQRLLEPTRPLLVSENPPGLVLWPESSLRGKVSVESITSGRARVLPPGLLPAARLLVGASIDRGGRETPAALLLEASQGTVIGHFEKQRLVPGGEFLPLLRWLPSSWGAALHDLFERTLGSAPDCEPGQPQPPLTTTTGVRFGALLCYDNAFPEPAAELVDAGAQFLCVLSNEAWYRGGGELAQLAAMTVCRALEVGAPFVRCTTDGWSMVVGADGRIHADLPIDPAPTPAARILHGNVLPGSGRLPPLAWLRGFLGPAFAVIAGALLLHGLRRCARLRAAQAPVSAAKTSPLVPPAAGGS